MSNHYFEAARAAGCTGLEQGMTGFHACASMRNCFNNRKPRKRKKKVSYEEIQRLLMQLAPPAAPPVAPPVAPVAGSGKKTKGGCGSCGPWITHVKAYQQKHGCSYKIALSEASKTYHK